jgi:hydroxymethylpyrimidine/phosphomethylpyrimidine kinase
MLLKKNAVSDMKNKLFPLADWITPNIMEAELILGAKIKNFDDALSAAELIHKKWNCGCVLKGGHIEYIKGRKSDIAVFDNRKYLISSPSIDVNGAASHGTGCTFSAALAANLAKGLSPIDAILLARRFVHFSLLEKVRLGRDITGMFPPENNFYLKRKNKKMKGIEICEII